MCVQMGKKSAQMGKSVCTHPHTRPTTHPNTTQTTAKQKTNKKYFFMTLYFWLQAIFDDRSILGPAFKNKGYYWLGGNSAASSKIACRCRQFFFSIFRIQFFIYIYKNMNWIRIPRRQKYSGPPWRQIGHFQFFTAQGTSVPLVPPFSLGLFIYDCTSNKVT